MSKFDEAIDSLLNEGDFSFPPTFINAANELVSKYRRSGGTNMRELVQLVKQKLKISSKQAQNIVLQVVETN